MGRYGSDMFWQQSDGIDSEIFMYNTASGVMQITDNSYDDLFPVFGAGPFGPQVTWIGDDLPGPDIFTYTSTITNLTNNDFNDHSPQMNYNGRVVWVEDDGMYQNIFLYTPGTKTYKLTTALTNYCSNGADQSEQITHRRKDG